MPVVSVFRCARCHSHRLGHNVAASPDGLVCCEGDCRVEACRCDCCCPNCEPEACSFMLGQRREKKASSTISHTPPVDKLPRMW